MKTSFPERMATARKVSGKSRKEVAQILGCGWATIANYETGRISPTLNRAIEISRLLSFSMDKMELTDIDMLRKKNKEEEIAKLQAKIKQLQDNL